MHNKKVLFIAQSAMIAAIYIVLLVVFAPISYGPVQVRIAEALTILPYFTPAAIPGLFVGCFLGGIVTNGVPIDFVFGSLATLVAAFLSYCLRKHKFLVPIPPILINAIAIPWVLRFAYFAPDSIPFMMLTVGIGEVIACGVLGIPLLISLSKCRNVLFPDYTNSK